MEFNSNGSVTPSVELQEAIKKALATDGERRTVERLCIARISVAKIAGGQPVRRGTAALAMLKLGLPVELSAEMDGVIGGGQEPTSDDGEPAVPAAANAEEPGGG